MYVKGIPTGGVTGRASIYHNLLTVCMSFYENSNFFASVCPSASIFRVKLM